MEDQRGEQKPVNAAKEPQGDGVRDQERPRIIASAIRLGATTVQYVTHDQTEAMTLGDHIVVMHGGKIQQVGSPRGSTTSGQPVRGRVHRLTAMDFLPAHLAEDAVRTVLSDLAADAGTADLPGGESGTLTTRLSAASQAREGERMHVWVDTSKVQLFDPSTGRNLGAAAGTDGAPDR